ncbi:hypothetical protein ES705_44570 [subsurface metagenome]
MSEKDIIKLIKSKSQAISENLLLSTELTEIKKKIEQFLDQNLKGDSLLSLRYRKLKLSSKPRTLWNDGNSGFPAGGGKNWIKPYIDFLSNT